MPSHLIFDFFGTLVRYSPTPQQDGYRGTYGAAQALGFEGGYTAFTKLWQQNYLQLEEVACATHQEFSMLDLSWRVLSTFCAEPGRRAADQLVESYLKEWNASVRYIDALVPMLTRLRGQYALSIVTNTHDTELVPGHLRSMGAENLFDDLVTSVAFGQRKPASAIFAHAVGRLGADAENCLYIGDNPEADYLGATGAGLQAMLVGDSVNVAVPAAHRLGSILELEQALAGT